MTPQQALDFLRNWTLEIMPAKFIPQFNEALVVLGKVLAQHAEKPPVQAASDG